ncbi:TonB-dependent receptor [Sandaracinobacter neustonicus]|uniref:TonB-dependent receptor n=1 Tax=Sandaracinobacter neustonicus TaxID=1715348 RepID=A0A501XKM7_9SPHN|nr:TonB-dependent receptor [Sandaracinobacter neustonicus]TPE60979.1 TonB-dependent receptor [Sandaracinobacter neustonicus]
MESRRKVRWSLLLAAACVIVDAGAAAAQGTGTTAGKEPSADNNQDAITVTARRVNEAPVEVPVTFSMIDGSALRDLGISNIREIVALVPNAVIQDSATGLNTFINIRGMQLVNIQAEPNVGVYRNGLYAGGHRQSLAAQVDIERVEVLRGPQGGYYGRSSIGGTVDIISTMPKQDFGGYARAGIGSYGRTEFEGAINVPVTETLAVRLTGWRFNQNRAEMKNETLDEYIGKSNDRGVRGTVQFDPVPSLNIQALAEYQEVDGPALISYAPNGISGNGLTFQPSTPETPQAVYRDTTSTSHRYNAYFFLKTSYDFGPVELALNGSYREYRFRSTYDLDQTNLGPPYNIKASTSPNDKVDNLYLEALLSSKPDQPFTWMIGAAYFKEDYDYQVLSNYTLNVDAVTGLPLGLGVQTIPVGSPKPGTSIATRSRSVFATASYEFDPHWTLSGGIRYNSDQKRLNFLSGIMPISNPLLAYVAAAAFGSTFPTFDLKSEQTFNFVAPTATLRYMPNKDVNFYLTYGQGFRPGAFNLTPVSAETIPYKEETASNFEAGVRTNLMDGKMSFNAAIFYMPQDNVLLAQSTPLGQSYYANAGQSKTKGIELELTARPLSWLSGGVSLGLLDAHFSRATVNAGTPSAIKLDGKQLPYTRSGTINAMINVDAPVSDEVNFISTGLFRFEWGGRLGDYVGVNEPYPALNRIDLQGGFEFRKQIRLTASVKNLLDEHVAQFYFYNGARTVTPGRTFSVDLRFSY